MSSSRNRTDVTLGWRFLSVLLAVSGALGIVTEPAAASGAYAYDGGAPASTGDAPQAG